MYVSLDSYDKCVEADDLYLRGMLMDLINSTTSAVQAR